MSAYIIALREGPVVDQAEMDEYQRKNRLVPPPATLKPLAVYGAIETLEGKATEGVVLLEFPSVQDARDWYHGDGYQAAAPHRIKSADYRVMIVEGL